MAGHLDKQERKVLQKVFLGSVGELSNVNPVVLSCGGIYVPHPAGAQRVIYHIITTSNEEMPVKVVTGAKPKNILQMALQKESMN